MVENPGKNQGCSRKIPCGILLPKDIDTKKETWPWRQKKNEQHPPSDRRIRQRGRGGGPAGGQAVFVKGALAGEICQVQLLKVGKSAAWGRVTQVLTPVPGRQSPDCPRYPRCGGCQLRHMTYAEELRFKRQKVQDALQRDRRMDRAGGEDPRGGSAGPVSEQNPVSPWPTALGWLFPGPEP